MSGLVGEIVLELIRTSGVRVWEEPTVRAAIIAAANEIAEGIDCMGLPDTFKVARGVAKTLTSSATSGNNIKITLASLANGNGTSTGAKQSDTIDLGANWAQRWLLETAYELAATPTAKQTINHAASYSSTTGAGKGNTSGSDAAYTGYSNNIDAAKDHLEFLPPHVCTSQATANVQKAVCGVFFPKGRYMNFVVDNRSGAAFHSSDANCVITLTPLEDSIED